MLVLSSPSGAGKTTIAKKLLERDQTIVKSISVTTRPRRSKEVEGQDYYYVTDTEYYQMIEHGELLEHAEIYGYLYGTPKKAVENILSQGKDILFDIDWQGAEQLTKNSNLDVVKIFILPPSLKELEGRLRKRAEDSEETIRSRMEKASIEISHFTSYDYVVINSDLESSVEQIIAILQAERCKRVRQLWLNDFVNNLLAEHDHLNRQT
jgi:guanylate kinase